MVADPPSLPLHRGADLTAADLAGRDLRGVDLRGACLRGADLRRANLARADLTGADLRGVRAAHSLWTVADLTGADLLGARAAGVDFTRAVLDGADLRHADFTGGRFERASLRRAALSGSRITGARLVRADLTDARLTGARLAGSHLSGAVLRGVVAVGARFAGCHLIGVDLNGARLVNADLRRARLAHADLRGADLRGADLREADLHTARLHGACLAEVDACWACFDRAALDGADLCGADLTWAHLDRITARATDLRRADLHRAWLCGDLADARFDHADLTGTWLGGRAGGARFDRADLRGLWPVGLELGDCSATGARVDANGLQILAARAVEGPLVLDLPLPLGGRLLHWPQRAATRIEPPDGIPWEGAGLALPVPGARLNIGPLPPRHRPPRWTGAQRFDDTVAIWTPDPVDTLARLDGALRKALHRWVGWGGTVHRHAVRIDALAPPPDPDAPTRPHPAPRARRLITALRIAAALAHPLLDPDAALMARLPDEPEPVRHRLLARWMVATDSPRAPRSPTIRADDLEGALRDLVVHGPAQAWAVVQLAGLDLRRGPIVAEGADLTGIALGTLRLVDGRFAGACLAGADLVGAEAERIDLRDADLRGTRLGRARLAHADLRGACFDGAQLFEAQLVSADLRGADLSNADLRGADLSNARLEGSDAAFARFVGARLDGARFDGCAAPGARFIRATGHRVSFAGATLTRAAYDRAHLTAVNWAGSDLRRARFRKARLTRASLAGAETRLAVFDEAHLEDVVMTGCHVDGGLVGARLQRVDLRRAHLAGDLDRADFEAVDLRGAHVAPESLRALLLRAVRIDLAGIAGLLAGRGDTRRVGPIRGATADGDHRFCWWGELSPSLTLWPTPDGHDAALHPDVDAAPDPSLDATLAAVDAITHGIRAHFQTPADPMPAEDDPTAGRAGKDGVRIPGAPVDLSLSKEGPLSTMRKALGGSEPHIGDPAFDGVVFVACTDPAALQARLDPPLRAALQRWVLDGGALSGGAVSCLGPIDRAQVVPTLRRALAIISGLTAPVPDVMQALWQRATLDPSPGVRAAALARWMQPARGVRLPPDPATLPPETLEPALLQVLDGAGLGLHGGQVVEWLGAWGTEAAVPRLTVLGGRWRTPLPLKQAVDRAIGRIIERVGGLRSGGLSMSTNAADGRVSPVPDDED